MFRNYFFSFFKRYFFFLFIPIFLLSCFGENSDDSSNNANDSRRLQRDEESSIRKTACRNGGSDQFSIEEADDISSKNAGRYEISGKCSSSDGKNIELRIGRGTENVFCSGNRWKTYLDVTSVVQDKNDVQISAHSGSNEACVSVKNTFLCPNDYVPVSRLKNNSDVDVDYDFCVMKYEARGEINRRSTTSTRTSRYNASERDSDDAIRERNEKAISKSNDDPLTGVSLNEAKLKCGNNGPGYRLITNGEWQTIARNIEFEATNWYLGRISIEIGNYLNRGMVSLGRGRSYSSGSSSSNWEEGKRSHRLLNEEEVWDISGGVWEMVSDSVSSLRSRGIEETNEEDIYELTGNNQELFGPERDYSSVGGEGTGRRSGQATLGLGKAYLSDLEDVIVRGGTSSTDAGIFAVNANIENGKESSIRNIGFRCVYHP